MTKTITQVPENAVNSKNNVKQSPIAGDLDEKRVEKINFEDYYTASDLIYSGKMLGLPVYTSFYNSMDDKDLRNQIKSHKKVHKVTKKGFIENIYLVDEDIECEGFFSEEAELSHKISVISRFLNNEFINGLPEDLNDQEIVNEFKLIDANKRMIVLNELKEQMYNFH